MRSNLEQVGIDVEVGKSGRRWITLKKSCANTVQTAQTVQVVQDNDLGADDMWTVRTAWTVFPQQRRATEDEPTDDPAYS